MMHQSEFDAANVALSRAADKRKSLINIHKNWYTATLRYKVHCSPTSLSCFTDSLSKVAGSVMERREGRLSVGSTRVRSRGLITKVISGGCRSSDLLID